MLRQDIYSNFNTLHKLENIIKLITNEPVETIVKKEVQPVQSKSKPQKKENIVENYSNEETRLAIQNEPMFIRVINIIRKIKPFTAVYVENGSHLVLVLSSALYFPVVFVKFELSYPLIHASGIDDIWFEFPLAAITSSISKTDKTSNRYAILFQEDNNDIKIKYISPVEKIERSLGSVVKISKIEALQQIFYGDRINSQVEFQEDIGKVIDYSQMINDMVVLMICEAKDFGNIEKTLGSAKLEYANHTLSVNHQNIVLKSELSSTSRSFNICNSKDCLYWKDSFDIVADLKMFPFASLFKNADKLKSKSDFSYYLFCEWKKYDSGVSAFMLIKLLINRKLDIDNYSKLITFESLVSSGNSIYEMFECYCPTTAIESNFVDDYTGFE